MIPELVSVGPFTLHSYGLAIAIGVFVSVGLMRRQARRTGFPPQEKIFDLVLVVVLAGLVGARLFYVVQEWEWYASHPLEVVQIWKGGLVYYGGMVVGFLAFFIYIRLQRLPFLALTDFIIPYAALTHAFGRVGCFLNGCCYGRASNLPWAVKFSFLAEAVHPTQIYEALFNLILFVVLLRSYERCRFQGEVTSLYLILYPMGRFFIEFFRGGQALWLSGLTFHQVLSFLFVLTGISLYGIFRLRR